MYFRQSFSLSCFERIRRYPQFAQLKCSTEYEFVSGSNGQTTASSCIDDILAEIDVNNITAYNAGDVEETVKEMVWKIVKEACNSNIDINVSDILEAGSYYEGTKLGFPDEFDYMVVLEIGNFIVKSGCGTGLVEFSQNEQTSSKTFNGRYVKENIVQIFRGSVVQQVSNFFERGVVCKGKTGEICVRDLSYPMLQLNWHDLQSRKDVRIKIDLMPALLCPAAFISSINHMLQQTHIHTIYESGLYLVPKTCPYCTNNSCWHLSFARAESHLMRSLDSCHKTAYRVLKHLVQIKQTEIDDVIGGTTSYMLKNAVLNHVFKSKCKEGRGLGKCVLDILQYLDECYSKLTMSLFFVPDWCLFRRGIPRVCKLNSLTMLRQMDDTSKQTLLNQESISATTESGVQHSWEFLVWNEYNRRYICLIRNSLQTIHNDSTHGPVQSENTRTCITHLESLVSLAESFQPTVARPIDFMENEHLILALKESRKHMIINEFDDLHKEDIRRFGDFIKVGEVPGVYPFNETTDADGTQSADTADKWYHEGSGNQERDTEFAVLYSRTQEYATVEPSRYVEVLDRIPPLDVDSEQLAVATTRSISLYSQLFLVSIDLARLRQDGILLDSVFDTLRTRPSPSSMEQISDEDYEASLLQYLDDHYGEEALNAYI